MKLTIILDSQVISWHTVSVLKQSINKCYLLSLKQHEYTWQLIIIKHYSTVYLKIKSHKQVHNPTVTFLIFHNVNSFFYCRKIQNCRVVYLF